MDFAQTERMRIRVTDRLMLSRRDLLPPRNGPNFLRHEVDDGWRGGQNTDGWQRRAHPFGELRAGSFAENAKEWGSLCRDGLGKKRKLSAGQPPPVREPGREEPGEI
jgi:hypothetical protein